MHADDPQKGQGDGLIPGYELLDTLGRGGFAVVHRARQATYDREVVVKVLDIDLGDERARRRFEREVSATGQLTGHPNIVTILDSGFTTDGRPYLTTPLFERGSVRDQVARDGPLPVDEALRIGIKVASALHAAHAVGILHRDLKPENILVSRYGEPALADFGIASVANFDVTQTATVSYTLNHAPPEVLEGRRATTASDVYGLGSTLYAMLAGHAAFESTSRSGLAPFLASVLHDTVPPLERDDVPAALVATIERAMAKDPADRYEAVAGFGEALQYVQAELGLPVTDLAGRAPRRPEAPETVQQHRTTSPVDSGVTVQPPPPPDQGTPADRREYRVEGYLTVVGGRGERGQELPALASTSPDQDDSRDGDRWGRLAAGVVALLVASVGAAWTLGVFGDADDPEAWRDYTITGVVPAGAEQATVGVRVNSECDCSAPADILLDSFALVMDGAPVGFANGDFAQGDEGWGYEGAATVTFSEDDGRDVMSIQALEGESVYLNGPDIPVEPGAPVELTITALIGADTGDAGYFAMFFLGPDTEVARLELPFDDENG